MAQPLQISQCCLQGFAWDGTPTGEESKLGDNPAYVVGPEDSDAAILLISDIFGWKFPNIRLLADYYAENVGARVYVPDFFGGDVLDWEAIKRNDFASLDMPGFMSRNGKDQRRGEIFACARELGKQHRRVGAMGFCYGGWAVMELGAREHNDGKSEGDSGEGKRKAGDGLVDCVATAHPTFVTQETMDGLGVPVQIQAPEVDPVFTAELKEYANRVIPTLGVAYEYLYFPGVEHGFATRGDSLDEKHKQAMRRSMKAAVAWFRFWLKPDDDEK